MEFKFGMAIATIFNFCVLIGIILVVVKVVKSITSISASNKNIERTLGRILEILEKDKK